MKKWLKALLFPSLSILVPLSILSGIGLFLVFRFSWERTALAYASYLCSAYGLAAWCGRAVAWGRKKLSALAERIPLLARYRDDLRFKAEVSIYLSLALNVAFAFYKAYLGVKYHSRWLGSVAAYYFLLSGMRFSLLHHILKREDDPRASLKRYRGCGYCLLILTFALSLMAYTVIRDNAGSTYPGHLIYITAGYTLYNLYLAIHNVVRYRKLDSPVLSASKCISLSCALVSVFTLQAAMFLTFGNDTSLQHSMNVITGAAVFTAVLAISLFMIVKASLALVRQDMNGREGR